MKKLFKALFIPSTFSIIPCSFVPELMFRPELWLTWFNAFILIISQPDGNYFPTAQEKDAHPQDQRSAQFIVIIYYILSIGWITNYIWLKPNFCYLSLTVGFIFSLSGIVLRMWSMRVLGKFFSTRVELQTNHELIQAGPFKLLRHPTYTGAIIAFMSTPIFFQLWWWIIPSLILLLLVYSYRIRIEEKVLLEQFGDMYRDYQQGTKKIIPYIY